jgi:glucose-6-phosphate isomerase
MWDWVGGRTSVTSAVGLLPAALQGIDCDAFLEGASRCDALTRSPVTRQNPAALLALMWYQAGEGRGTRDMVLLPYSDRLILFSRYLQQLVMESIGKELDLSGASVHQGLSVFGNKGSTDQHAYVQQLRDGINNFFVTFIEVLSDGREELREVEKGVTSGDYLFGFLHGTRQALTDRGRESITITIERLDARTVGALVALYERAVGLYALLVNINAYHQPGVEAGKKVAATIIELQQQVVRQLASATAPLTAEALASAIGSDNSEAVYHILQRLAANPERRISMQKGSSPKEHRFSMKR